MAKNLPIVSSETPPETFLTMAEVGRIFRVAPRTVTQWCDDGILEHIKTPGGHRRIPLREVLRYTRATNGVYVLGDDGL